MAGNEPTKLPVTILTGFLGSGKTTVLNHLLKQPGMKSTAVIINEFGEIGIDHLLVETSTEQMVELNNGCICCTIRGDLADKLGSLAMWLDTGRVPPVERVVVETTGLADPAPILHTLMTDGHMLKRYRLGSVVTLVDALAGPSSLERFPEAVKQAAMADTLVFSKLDLVEPAARDAHERFKARLRQINPRATLREARKGELDTAALADGSERDAEAAFAEFSAWLEAAARTATHDGNGHDHEHPHAHEGIASVAVELERPVDGPAFNGFLQDLALEFGEHLLRTKGILYVKEEPERPAVIQGVQHVFFPVTWLERWPDGERMTRLVFITQHLAPERITARFPERFA